MYLEKKVVLNSWIYDSTLEATFVVELGAGFFDKLSYVHENVDLKIGIEIWEPYIKHAKFNECIKVQGNLLEYKKLLQEYDLSTGVCMLVDVLEHFDKETAFSLINNLKKDFNKIIVMLPGGKHIQTSDVTGYGAHTYQTHRSYWYKEDLILLGFDQVVHDVFYHKNPGKNKTTSCYFCTWQTKE